MIIEQNKTFTCIHCNSKFSKEKTLMIHMCEQKRRHLAKEEKHVILAFYTFNKFYQINQKTVHNKTYEEFSKSPYYNAFVKFGSFLNNINPLYTNNFIEWVVKSGIKIDHWCRDELYEKYVIELLHTESVETALERSIQHMTVWANLNDSIWNHYFNYVSTNRAMFDIKDGKISPWLLLNSTKGKELLNQFRDDQLAAISTIIDPKVWVKKFKQQQQDLELVRTIIKESNL